MESRHIRMFSAVQIVVVGVLLYLVFTRPGPWTPQRYCGTGLILVGAAGVATARYQLGKSFSFAPEAHQLVTRGLYSKIRNPIYVFGVILVTGLALIIQKKYFWLLLLVVMVGQAFRARREARVLEAAFGDAYREYRRKTWF
jgi:protein-S-isoprenylcysteine O-methyltransferase Ste14